MEDTQEVLKRWVVCRICLQNSKHPMQSIFDSELHTQITECVGLVLFQHDNVPNKLCLSCQLLLRASLKLRTLAQRSQRILSEMVQISTVKAHREDNAPLTLRSKNVGEVLFEDETIYGTGLIQETNNHFESESCESSVFEEDIQKDLNDIDDSVKSESISQIDPAHILKIDSPTSEFMNNLITQNELDQFLQPNSTKKIKLGMSSRRKRFSNKIKDITDHEAVAISSQRPSKTTYFCSVCGNIYPDRVKLAAHTKIHNKSKPHKCEICQKCFRQTPQLARHMNSHTGNRPYACTFCEASFADPSTCIKHQRIHTNERPYKCHVCGKAFAYSNVLKVHLKVHSGEKPYSCRFCKRLFTQLHHKNAHERSHADTSNVLYILNEE